MTPGAAIDAAALHAALPALLERIAAEIFADPVEVAEKGDSGLDFVTSVDLAVQARLEAELAMLLPGSAVVGEEGFAGMDTSTRPVWLVDPLDGTVNFVAGLPAFAIAVVLVVSGAPVLAAVRDIVQGTTYSAIAGGGAFRDGAPMARRGHGARLAVLSSGLLADLAAHSPETLSRLLRSFKLRNLGSQALHLCHAAAGHVSLVASREARGWDDLAGALIAREAGLRYGHYAGSEQGISPGIGAEQHSLCAPADLFDTHVSDFALSLGPRKGPTP